MYGQDEFHLMKDLEFAVFKGVLYKFSVSIKIY